MISTALFREYKNIRFSLKDVKRIVSYVCRREGIKSAEMSFVFVGDRTMKLMNKKFLQHDYNTDVITFPLSERGTAAEIYINVEQARRQAKKYSVFLKNEMTRLIVHGALHTFGYDDKTKSAKKKMFNLQEQYISELSLK